MTAFFSVLAMGLLYQEIYAGPLFLSIHAEARQARGQVWHFGADAFVVSFPKCHAIAIDARALYPYSQGKGSKQKKLCEN